MKDQQNLLESLQKLSAQEIISLFGGIRPMANKLEVAVSTVQGWKERNKIPNARYTQILAVAIESGLMNAGDEQSVSAEPQLQQDEVEQEPLLMQNPHLDMPIAHRTIVKQSIFSRALLSVLTIGCLILAGSTLYLYKQVHHNQALLSVSNVKISGEALLYAQDKLSELENSQQLLARDMHAFMEKHIDASANLLKQDQLDAVNKEMGLIAKKLGNLQSSLLSAQAKFSEKTNDLQTLEARFGALTTKNTSLPMVDKGLQSKYLTLWLVQANLEEKLIQGGQFQQEYRVLKALDLQDKDVVSLLGDLEATPNLYFFFSARFAHKLL